MISVDLLKGEGRPIKSRPGVVALMVVPFIFPVLAGVFLVGWYQSDKIMMRVQVKKLTSYNEGPQQYSDVEQLLQDAAAESKYINSCLIEVSGTINHHRQWSPVLSSLTENLPPAVSLNSLELLREKKREKIPDKDDTQKTVLVDKYQYTLRITTDTGTTVEDDAAVQVFIQQLRNSSLLAPRIEDIRIASQQSVSEETVDIVRYEIDCVFKMDT